MIAVAAVLAGASFLGGGLALGGLATDRIAAGREPEPEPLPSVSPSPEESPSPTEDPFPSPEPTEEASEPPTQEPEDLASAEDVVEELSGDYDLQSGVDASGDLCEAEDEEDAFVCTSAVDTNLVRIIAFENMFTATLVVAGLQSQVGEDDNDMADVQSACHIVFVWFEGGDMDQGERDSMVSDTEAFTGC